jgi:glycosyltransferase involved in cell wall biosynthesis
VKSLVVLPWFPWPAELGGRIRSDHVVRALARRGEVDVFAMVRPDRYDDARLPDDAPVNRLCTVVKPYARAQGLRRITWLLDERPRVLSGQDYRQLHARFRQWAANDYDVVWCHRIDSWVAIESFVEGTPVVIDFDDLEDEKLWRRASARGSRVDDRLRAWIERLDGHRWDRLQRTTAARVTRVAVCSEFDRERLGVPNAVVVPNGYPGAATPLGRRDIGTPPVVLFQGDLTRAPNVDAARRLVVDILPFLQRTVADVQVRLVGNANDAVRALAGVAGVVVTGSVAAMEPELARADVVAVALRSGGGTPIKVLEAFAHRIPVVTSSFVADPLELMDGREALIRDDPEDFAEACASLLVASERRNSLVDAAHERFLERYESTAVERVIGEVASAAASSVRSRGRSGA